MGQAYGGGAASAPGAMGAEERRATRSRQVRARRWGLVLGRVGRHVLSDRLMVLSAGISFFAFLSVDPVFVLALSVSAVVNPPEQAMEQLSRGAGNLPAPLEPVVADQLSTVTAASSNVLTWPGITGLLVALCTATTAAIYLIDALTLAYHETESRRLLRRSGLALTFVLGGALLLAAVIAVAGLISRALPGAPAPVRAIAPVLAWSALAALMTVVLAVLYRLAPDRRRARWRWISGGAAMATVLWIATSVGLLWYVQRSGTYESTYGSLAGVAISMVWLWITVFLVIVGAAVNAEAERQTARDSTAGPEQEPGERGAAVADAVPANPGGG